MMEEAVGPVDEITQLPLIEQEVLGGHEGDVPP